MGDFRLLLRSFTFAALLAADSRGAIGLGGVPSWRRAAALPAPHAVETPRQVSQNPDCAGHCVLPQLYRKGLIRDLFSAEAKFDPATGQRTRPKTTDPSRRDRILQKHQNYIANIPGMRSPFGKDLTTWIGAGFPADDYPVLR